MFFIRSAGEADHGLGAQETGDLAGKVTRCTGCGRNDDRIARLDLQSIDDAEIGRQPAHAEHAEIPGQREVGLRQLAQRHRAVGADDGVILPAHETFNEVARRIIRIERVHNLTDAHAPHRLSRHDGLHVAAIVRQPDPLACIVSEIERADENVTVAQRGYSSFHIFEILPAHGTNRPALENPLAVRLCHDVHVFLPLGCMTKRIAIALAQILLQNFPDHAARQCVDEVDALR